jgi:hypothetical protein
MPPPPALRFVILRHEGVADPHYDLMFELAPGAPLATWRSPVWPITLQVPITQVPDHRQLYLDHEGPVSHNRGHVQRVVGGTHRYHRLANRLAIHILHPTALGTLMLQQTDDTQWTAWPG